MTIEQQIRQRIPFEEFDYQVLLDVLSTYSRPRDKITNLLKKGVIIRVKKGLYVFGPDFARKPYSRELLANLIHGPSYVSLDYALSYYGMIPERVEAVTCVTSGKSRVFHTPIGRFTYQTAPLAYYRTGIDIIESGDGRSFLMATREKALTDRLRQSDGSAIRTLHDLEAYVFDHLRLDSDSLSRLDTARTADIARSSGIKRLRLLSDLVNLRGGALS
jgi:predicted transcriptional regulator of viral defense system